MSAFWCVFWWVLLGFVLGWLCNWLLHRRLSGDDGGQTAVNRTPDAAPGEGSGMNWQTQMVDISRTGRTPQSAASGSGGIAVEAASQSRGGTDPDKGTDTETEKPATDAGAEESAFAGTEREAPTAGNTGAAEGENAAVFAAEVKEADTGGDAAQEADVQDTDAQETAAQAEVQQGKARASGASDLPRSVPEETARLGATSATSLFASEKHSRGNTFAGIDGNDSAAPDTTEADVASGVQAPAGDEKDDKKLPVPVFAAVVSVSDDAAGGDGKDGKAKEQEARTDSGSSTMAAGAVKPEQEGLVAAVLDRAAARAAGFSVKGEDDLTVVEGIGPKISRLFKDAGILTLAELSRTPTQRLQEILNAGGSRYRLADPTTWAQQAGLAASNSWTELKTFQDTLDGGRLIQ